MIPNEIEAIVAEFAKACGRSDQIKAEFLPAPHRPRALQSGWQGVYAFRFQGVWLKVGKVGPKSNARWVSQHYNARAAMSNLAWSLLRYAHYGDTEDPRLPQSLKLRLQALDADTIGDWLKQHTDRCNILIIESLGKDALAQLETEMIAALRPVFEGQWAFGGSLPQF
jgi:hypothetical protein